MSNENTNWFRIIESVAQIRHRRELFTVIYDRIKSVFPFDECGLCYLCDTSGQPVSEGEYCINILEDLITETNAEIFAKFKIIPVRISESPIKNCYVSAEPIIGDVLSDLKKYPTYYETPFILKSGVCEYISVPIKNRGAVFGHVIFFSKQKNFYSENDFPRFKIIADQLGIAMANVLAYEEIAAREREKTLLLSLSEDIASIRNANDLLRVIYDKIKTIFPFDNAGLFIIDASGEHHRDLFIDYGLFDSELYHTPFPTGWIKHKGSVIEHLMQEPQIHLIDFVELTKKYPHHPHYEPMLGAGIKQLIGTQLKQGDKTLGILFFNSLQADFYSESDFSLFKSIANQIAVGLYNILANEEILQREREASVLLHISKLISSARNFVDLFKVFTEEFKPLMGFDDFVLAVLSKDKTKYKVINVESVLTQGARAFHQVVA
jgi:formate hydrogenlyase transcriptional activator